MIVWVLLKFGLDYPDARLGTEPTMGQRRRRDAVVELNGVGRGVGLQDALPAERPRSPFDQDKARPLRRHCGDLRVKRNQASGPPKSVLERTPAREEVAATEPVSNAPVIPNFCWPRWASAVRCSM